MIEQNVQKAFSSQKYNFQIKDIFNGLTIPVVGDNASPEQITKYKDGIKAIKEKYMSFHRKSRKRYNHCIMIETQYEPPPSYVSFLG